VKSAGMTDLRDRQVDRENFAAKSDVAVVQTKVMTAEAAIVRIDASIGRIDETLVSMKEMLARLNERSKDDRVLTRFVVLPLMLLMQATLFGILTRGILWAVAP